MEHRFEQHYPNGFLALGDSVTYGADDDNPPPDGENGFPPLLTDLTGWVEMPSRIAKPGWTVALYQDTIQADIASRTGRAPRAVFVALGSNDIGALADPLDPETWQGGLGNILDVIHARYPQVVVFVDQPWRRFDNGQLDDLCDVWIPAVLASRAWSQLGSDWRVVLEAGDDGQTYTTDGIHPNHAGFIRLAQHKASLLATV